jgi:fructosamine-3-kinase
LHGDLWSGNFLVKGGDTPILIDPAIYYGNREMDIAMSKLFGGFNSDFYFAYNESYPLENGWEERIQICNLYPLLVHVNLFGGAYINQVKNILSYYVG